VFELPTEPAERAEVINWHTAQDEKWQHCDTKEVEDQREWTAWYKRQKAAEAEQQRKEREADKTKRQSRASDERRKLKVEIACLVLTVDQ
jgi:hypothetical protein